MHCRPQLEPAKGSPSFTCQIREDSIKNSLTQKLSLIYKKHPAAHYVHAALIYHIQRKAIKASQQVKRHWGKICWQLERTRHDEERRLWREREGGAFQTRAPWPQRYQGASFYLSAGLRPAGTGRRAGTGRHRSRTLASSRTSRAEAERSLPPAGRRLTGRRRRPSAGVCNECRYRWWYCLLLYGVRGVLLS